jgi:hypothetical protein
MYKSVKLKESTYDWLLSQGKFRESMDDIILRLAKKQNKKEVTS